MKQFLKLNGWSATLAIATTLLCCAARANTITVTGVDGSRGEYNVWIAENGVDSDTYYAGVILIQLANSAGTFNRDTMCIQLFTDIYLYQTYATQVVSPDSQGGGSLDRVSWLEDNALLPTQSSVTSVLPQSDWVTTAAQGAGLQLAIWDIVQDGGDGFTAGSVQEGSAANPTDPTVLGWAETYEALSLGQSSADAFVYLNVSLGDGSPAQNLEGPEFLTDGGPQPTPEGPSLMLAGSALVGLGLVRRRGPAKA